MKNVIHFPLAIIGLALFSACSNKPTEPVITVGVVREFTLSEETQEHLHRLTSVVMDNPVSDELAFANFQSPVHVVITDYDGKFVEKVGKEGRGPDEIQRAWFFGFDSNENVVILDKPSAFYKYHDRLSDEVRSYVYPLGEGFSVTSRNLEQCGEYWYSGIQILGKQTYEQVPIVGVFDQEFALVDTIGGYDPFFAGRGDFMQEPVVSVDCSRGLIYTTHAKTPYIQVFSMDSPIRVHRTDMKPASFNLSELFSPMAGNSSDTFRFLANEQSTSLHVEQSEHHIYHVFRNEHDNDKTQRHFEDRDYYVAVYDIDTYEYLGETQIDGAVLGATKDGYLIVLKDERTYEMQFLEISSK